MKPLTREDILAMGLEPEVEREALKMIDSDHPRGEPERHGGAEGESLRVLSSDYQRPQAFGGDHGSPTVSLDAYIERGGSADYQGGGLEPSAEDAYFAGLEDDENDDLTDAVLAGLTSSERALYDVIFGEGLSVREAADRLGIPKSSIHRAKANLRDRLAEEYVRVAGGES